MTVACLAERYGCITGFINLSVGVTLLMASASIVAGMVSYICPARMLLKLNELL